MLLNDVEKLEYLCVMGVKLIGLFIVKYDVGFCRKGKYRIIV